MVDPLLWVAFVLVAGLTAFKWRERLEFARARIHVDLGRARASAIEMTMDWLAFRRDTLTFNVAFTTPDGRRHTNRCQVTTNLQPDAPTHWERAVEGAA
jgi:hypothetical protein